jgi:hypothetical protein
MQFLAPLMLVGIAGVSVPIAIHLIGRRKAPVRKFAAMEFLLGTKRRVASRLILRERLLLLLRVLACLVIPLALAKPFFSYSSPGPVVARGPQAVVLVLDNSLAMGYRQGGETLFAKAKGEARRVLQGLGGEASVAVVLSAEGASAPVELSRDHLRLLDTIHDAELVLRPADTVSALRHAAALLAASPHSEKRIYLFSLLASTGFAAGQRPWPEGQGPELHVVDLVGKEALSNVAVVSARVEADPALGARAVRVVAEIGNFGARPVEGRAVTVWIGGKAVARGLLTLGAGEVKAKRFAATLPPPDEGRRDAIVEVDGDALATDDRRYIRLASLREVRVLVVNGDPRTVRREDETYYLEMALRPGDRADSALAVSVVTPDVLPRRRLSDFDVVFLCNVQPLEAARVAELAAWVDKGGGLFVALGDRVEADAYNESMGALLAQELGTLHDVGKDRGTRPGRAGEPLGRIKEAHPVFSLFSDGVLALRRARFRKIFLLGPSLGGDRQSLASFESGAPALVEARLGQGRLFLFTSTIDRDWNDLPIFPGFLPFVQEATRYLARSPMRERMADVMVGRSVELPILPTDRRVEVMTPGGDKSTVEGEGLAGRQTIAFAGTREPGFYRVTVLGSEGGLQERPSARFAVNLDPRASDVRPADLADLAGKGGAKGPASTSQRRVELWHALAAALLLFLLGEAFLSR